MNISDNNRKLFQSMSVLYVEDDKELAQEVTDILSTLFKSVDTCSNGQDGLIQYTTQLYDIVITDINMPKMDGLSMSQEIRHINPNQHIIVISAYEDTAYFLKCLELGIDGFITKPFVLDTVLETFIKVSHSIEDKNELLALKKNLDKKDEDNISTVKNSTAFKSLLRTQETMSLILLNIDNFSNINSAYGEDYADSVLEEISKNLVTLNIKDIEIYKLESDEYALVNRKNLDTETAIETANFLVSFFNETEIESDEDINLFVSFSIGINIGKGIALLNRARMAIKELREHTRGTYKVYDMKSNYMRKQQDNVYWVRKIQESIADDAIVAFFQAIVNNHTQKIEKYECLARIYDDGDYISPFHFMDAAKETRQISMITKSMIKQSCKMFSGTEYEFSLNITNDDLQMEYLEDYLLRNCERYSINPNRIVLELLEDISTLEKGSILKQLASLREKGFKLAIDDFGSESSNFSRLLEFDADYLKIDGAFIKNIVTDVKSQMITEGIVFIAHKLGIKVIAEFIHSQEVQDKMVALGIDYSQGYFHGAPSKELI